MQYRQSLPDIWRKLLDNSRFWILSSGIVLSINIAGFIQTEVPSGVLQLTRLEQTFGFISLLCLYAALSISPLTNVFPRIPRKATLLHARRAIGVLAFYFAGLHVCISFFGQLGGFSGVPYLSTTYRVSLLCGIGALAILSVLALTSLDWAVHILGFKNWKLLHRLVYTASAAIIIHIVIIGAHYTRLTLLSGITYGAIALLVLLEGVRIYKALRGRALSS